MSEAGDKYFNRLIEVSTLKQNILVEIEELTQKQSDSIHDDDIDSLEKLVQQKQIKIDEMIKLDEQFEVYFMRMKFELKIKSLDEVTDNHVSVDLIKSLKELTSRILDLSKTIAEMERDNSAQLKNVMSVLQGEIVKLNQGRKINNIYSSSTVASKASYFIDKKK
jgi:hypothetical protein